jgi:hypothetical protein
MPKNIFWTSRIWDGLKKILNNKIFFFNIFGNSMVDLIRYALYSKITKRGLFKNDPEKIFKK